MSAFTSDPRGLPGDIAGPGGPHVRGGVVLDTSRAILLDECLVSTIDELGPNRGRRLESAFAMLLSGRINHSQERARVLFLFGTDGAAAIITELIGLYGRAGVDVNQLMADVTARMDQLGSDGNLTPADRPRTSSAAAVSDGGRGSRVSDLCVECQAPTMTERGCPACNLRRIAQELRSRAEALEWEASHIIVRARRERGA